MVKISREDILEIDSFYSSRQNRLSYFFFLFLLLLLVCLVVLGFELRALSLLGRYSIAQATLLAPFPLVIFETESYPFPEPA
jgi:hypothetical protein